METERKFKHGETVEVPVNVAGPYEKAKIKNMLGEIRGYAGKCSWYVKLYDARFTMQVPEADITKAHGVCVEQLRHRW